MSNEQRYYDVLKRIASGYQTSAKLRRNAGQYGCSFEEEIEMAYENIQEEAKRAIKGQRRPSGPPAESPMRGTVGAAPQT
jgi:hypothetical protein